MKYEYLNKYITIIKYLMILKMELTNIRYISFPKYMAVLISETSESSIYLSFHKLSTELSKNGIIKYNIKYIKIRDGISMSPPPTYSYIRELNVTPILIVNSYVIYKLEFDNKKEFNNSKLLIGIASQIDKVNLYRYKLYNKPDKLNFDIRKVY